MGNQPTFGRVLRTIPLVIAALFVCLPLLAGCSNTAVDYHHGRIVIARLTDILFASAAPIAHATCDYPRVTLANATRLVLTAETIPAASTAGEHASLDLDLPQGARLEVDIGADGEGPHSAWIAIANADGERELVRMDDLAVGHWHAVRADLPAGALTLRFYSRSPAGGRVWFGAPVVTAPARQPLAPNVILVSLDTLRADALGVYGSKRATSPNIDRDFGQRGLIIEHAYTQGPGTVYGHVSMLRGIPFSAGVKAGGGRWNHSRGFTSIADELRAAGWRTAAFTEDAMVDGAQGFDWGFERWFENVSLDAASKIVPGRPKLIAVPGHIESTFDHGLDWLEQHADQPVFLFLHTYQTHSPFTPPERFADLFPIADDAGPAVRERALYDREVVYTDEIVGRLVANVDRILGDRPTLIVITSDHGEEFGDHGRRGHGTNLTDATLRVPMLFRDNANLLPAGMRRPGPAALMDLAPTILDLLKLPIPERMEGISLLEHLRAGAQLQTRALPHEAWGLRATTYGGYDATWKRPSYGITAYPLRVTTIEVEDGLQLRMYDLAADPGEQRDLAAEGRAIPPALASAARGVLKEAEVSWRTADWELPRPVLPQRRVEGLDEDRAAKLQALGYIDDDPGMR